MEARITAFPCPKCQANSWVPRPDAGLLWMPDETRSPIMTVLKASCLVGAESGFTRFQIANCGNCALATVVPWEKGTMEIRSGRFFYSGREF